MSNFIKCTSCGHEVSITSAQYQSIAEQVRGTLFEEEITKRLAELSATIRADFAVKTSKRELEYAEQCNTLKFECKEQCRKLESRRDVLESDLKSQRTLIDSKVRQAVLASENTYQERIYKLQSQVTVLESDLKNREVLAASAVQKAVFESDKTHEEQLRHLNSELDYYKNLKLNMSTKMVGESLENWCCDEFNKLRMTAFSKDYFEKDNKLSETGSKGDFIYRAYDENGEEILSIMFEMKSEMANTVAKHKNQDFLRELDKDRKEKKCEYAVLCSLLESDSEFYNQGIVDMSYQYSKLYVIRPQFFISLISMLRNMAAGQTMLRSTIAKYERENLDLVSMQTSIQEFQTGFSKNLDLSQRKFDDTVLGIDKAIVCLQKTKDSLLSCERNMRLAGDKLDKIGVRYFAKHSPSILQIVKVHEKDNLL